MTKFWLPCVFSETVNISEDNLLKASISKSVLDSVLKIENDENSTYFAAIADGISSRKTGSLFISLIVDQKIDIPPQWSTTPVALTVSKFFFEHYTFLKPSCVYFMKIVTPHPLEKIVLATKSKEIYDSIRKNDWTMQLMLKVCKEKVLCRQGDIFIWPNTFNDITVLECQPSFQGLLSIKTQITIVKLNLKPTTDFNQQLTLPETSKKFNMFAYWTVMQYLSCFIFPSLLKKTQTLNPVLSIIASAYSKFIDVIKPKFNIRIIPIDPFFMDCDDTIDPTNVIFMNEKTAKILRIKHGDWVLISLIVDNEEIDFGIEAAPVQKKRWCQVYCLPNKKLRMEAFGFLEDDSFVYISPNLWFNLNKHPSVLIQPKTKLSIIKVHRGNDNTLISVATEINISLVQAPYSDSLNFNDELLHKYFDKKRYVQKGDILCIETHGFDVTSSNAVMKGAGRSLLYFKVSSVFNKCKEAKQSVGYFISKKMTSLYQVPSVFSYIPKTMDVYVGLKEIHAVWTNPVPVGLQEYVNRMQDVITTYLKNKY